VLCGGRPHPELPRLAAEVGADRVHFASDVSPYAMRRDERVAEALARAGVEVRRTAGNFVADVGRVRTKDGRPFTVFSPFWRAWEQAERREVHGAPRALSFPGDVRVGAIPKLADLGLEPEVAEPFAPGEAAARERATRWLAGGLERYHERHDRLAGGTSELSPYLHLGCLSARELEQRARAKGGEGAADFVRQLCWRDFYAHVLLHHPRNARHEFNERYAELEWADDAERLSAW
jgi:deoxyribodipyrimidine photo-lyase